MRPQGLCDQIVSTFHRRTDRRKTKYFLSLSHRMRACLFSLVQVFRFDVRLSHWHERFSCPCLLHGQHFSVATSFRLTFGAMMKMRQRQAQQAHTHVQTLMRHLISAWFSKSSARFTCAKMIQFHLTIRTIGRPSQQILIIAYYNFPFSCDLHNLEIERNWKNRAFIQQEISELVRIKETHFPVNEWVCECLCRNDLWRRREKIHELLTTAHALIPRAQIFSEQRARSSVRTKLCIACTSNYRTNREKGLSLSLSENKLNCLRASNKFGIHFRKAATTILSGTRTNLIFVRTSTKSILRLGKKKQFFEFNWAKVSQVENVHSRDKSISAKSCVKLRADCDVSR